VQVERGRVWFGAHINDIRCRIKRDGDGDTPRAIRILSFIIGDSEQLAPRMMLQYDPVRLTADKGHLRQAM
jgi:hypothetical protein